MPLLPQNDLNDDVYIVSPSTTLIGPGRHFPKSLLRSINLPLDVRSLDLACLLGLHEIFSDRIVVLPWPHRITDVSKGFRVTQGNKLVTYTAGQGQCWALWGIGASRTASA